MTYRHEYAQSHLQSRVQSVPHILWLGRDRHSYLVRKVSCSTRRVQAKRSIELSWERYLERPRKKRVEEIEEGVAAWFE